MPTISDPGFKLVEALLSKNYEIDVIPGPTAVESALALSGLPTDKFSFIGFLPRERSKIKKLLDSSFQIQNSIIYYESPFRVIKTLEIISEISEEIEVAACNDLTKKFQKVYRGKVKDVIEQLKSEKKVIGEWTVVINSES
jgi:16S rRNA (cytidine1402-2'-O)-methyltransferase